MSEFARVGKVKDAHGIRGELFILLFAPDTSWLSKLKSVRLTKESGEFHSEYEVKSVRPHKNGLIVKSNIKDRNQAETLKGLLFEIPRSFLISQPGEAIYLSEIKGFMVSDERLGEVGQVVAFSSNNVQDLLVVRTPEGEEYEVPFVKQLVTSIDYDAKKIAMSLPPGLVGDLDEDDDIDDGGDDEDAADDETDEDDDE